MGSGFFRSSFKATSDTILAQLNRFYLPDAIRPGLIENRWQYKPTPCHTRNSPCATQGSYRLYFRYGDMDALRDMARLGDILTRHGIRFDIGGIRNGKNARLIFMVPESDMRKAIKAKAQMG